MADLTLVGVQVTIRRKVKMTLSMRSDHNPNDLELFLEPSTPNGIIITVSKQVS